MAGKSSHPRFKSSCKGILTPLKFHPLVKERQPLKTRLSLFSLLAHGQPNQIPQVLPVLQEAAELDPSESEAPSPLAFDAKVDIFFRTCSLPQDGQTTPSVLNPKISSSKGCSQSLHTNSKIGIFSPWHKDSRILDAETGKKLHQNFSQYANKANTSTPA